MQFQCKGITGSPGGADVCEHYELKLLCPKNRQQHLSQLLTHVPTVLQHYHENGTTFQEEDLEKVLRKVKKLLCDMQKHFTSLLKFQEMEESGKQSASMPLPLCSQ